MSTTVIVIVVIVILAIILIGGLIAWQVFKRATPQGAVLSAVGVI
jgi:hypothetical protein